MVCRVVGQHILDLAAALIGEAGGAHDDGAQGGLRAARLLAIKSETADHLDGDVFARSLARRHHVSPRHVHKLFESEGASVSQHLLGLRLETAWRRLRDTGPKTRAITAIAHHAGFGDFATFNRASRARVGMTPRNTRGLDATAAADLPPARR